MAEKRKNRGSAKKITDNRQIAVKSVIWPHLFAFAMGAVLTASCFLVFRSNPSEPQHSLTSLPFDQDTGPKAGKYSVMELLALPDKELEKIDILELNLAVAREAKGLEKLDYNHYKQIIDNWTQKFLQWLPVVEQEFYQNPERWENDINFARIGALAQWLDQAGGVAYIEEQKNLKEIQYTNLGHLLIHGLIDTKRGTCGNMPVLHVAMGRRCGWPVSLACVDAHYVCRYDNGRNIYNFETTDTGRGGFAMEPDEGFIEEFNLSKRAISSGSDLRSLTARETLAVFIGARGRYYRDTDQMDLADRDYSLARSMFPNYRKLNTMSLPCFIWRAKELFDPGEFGHPASLASYINSQFPTKRRYVPPKQTIDDIMRMNEENMRRMETPSNQGLPQNNPNFGTPDPMSPMTP